MKTSKCSEAQITYAQRQAERGTAVRDVSRQLGISAWGQYRAGVSAGGVPSDLVVSARQHRRADRIANADSRAGAQSPAGKHVVGAFEDRIGEADFSKSLTVDHGTECTATAVDAWAFYRGVALDFTRRSEPTDHGHIESFTGRLRDACVNVHQFLSLDHAKRVIDAWCRDYNSIRPQGSMGNLTPNEFVAHHQATQTANTA